MNCLVMANRDSFPELARNISTLREKAEEYNARKMTRDDYDLADSMERNRICNMGLYVSGFGEIPILAVGIGIVTVWYPCQRKSTENKNRGLSVLIGWGSAALLVLAIPWFVLEKRSPGQPVLPGMNIVVAGYFFLGDSLNTIVTVVQTLQNEMQEYNTIVLVELLITGLVAQSIGNYVYMAIQRNWDLSTKTMLSAVAVGIIMLGSWGLIGIWTQKIGFHQKWEFWFYQVFYGLFISEVTPRGKESLFFSLFNIIGKASSFVGPYISSAIIDASPTNNSWTPFYFLTGLSCLSFAVILFFVDLAKSQKEQEKFLADEMVARRALAHT